jgi:hypothetical protein
MWLWGPVGLLLATPLTVCLLVVGKHVPELSFLSILLGSDPVFEPYERIFQRLLAGDSDGVADFVDDCVEKQSLTDVYDTIIIPAIGTSQSHWQLGKITDIKHEFIMESLKELIQEQDEHNQGGALQRDGAVLEAEDSIIEGEGALSSPRLSVLCIPARSEADEIAATMLTQVLKIKGCQARTISLLNLDGNLQGLVEQFQDIDLVCISAMSPAAVMHARYLCKRLRDQVPNVRLLVGLWDFKGDTDRATLRIGCEAMVVTTMRSAEDYIDTVTPWDSEQKESRTLLPLH